MEIKVNFNRLQNALNETGTTLKYRFSLGKANNIFSKVLTDFDKTGSLLTITNNLPNFYGGLLVYKNIFVYALLNKKNDKSSNIHFSSCDVLKNNLSQASLHLSNSDLFKESGELQKGYKPCESCLHITNWNNFSLAEDWAKRIVIRQFNIKHIHDHIISFQKELLSKIHSKETLLSIPNNFLRILEIIKAKKKWICQICKVDTSGYKQTFHIMPTKDHRYTENEGDYYGLCVLCLKRANNYVITYPEEIEYLNKNRLNKKDH